MATARRWKRVWYRHSTSDVHVLPIHDLREHVETRECWCEPAMTRERFEAAMVVVHHAADGRELVEEHGIN